MEDGADGDGDEHTCAASATGEVYCRGANEYGQASGDFHGYPHAVVSLAAP
ncbi:MAG: hypothetical protein HY905_26525 [Deltaproteobacteria bacterium]|nr:hypothetical protein [Deltaproteobacteria bacterium]